MNYVGKKGLRVCNNKVWHEGNFNPGDKANAIHTHTKSNIVDMPTKLSDFINDIGTGVGIIIVTSATEPANLKTGDQWHMVY